MENWANVSPGPSDSDLQKIAQLFGFNTDTVKLLMNNRGAVSPSDYLNLMTTDNAFAEDQIFRFMCEHPELVTEDMKKRGINWEQAKKSIYQDVLRRTQK